MSHDKRKPVPSPKHTLDDVLKTLQDLVRNELADENAGRGRPARAAPAARTDDTDDMGAVDAVDDYPDAAAPVEAARAMLAANADTLAEIDGSVASDSSLADTDARSHSDATETAADIGAELSALFADETDAVGERTDATGEIEDSAIDGEHAVDGIDPADTAAAHDGPEQTSINWDDIPVLNEIVALPTQVELAQPNPRTVAVRVIAKLNIELRKAGNTPLDPVIIDRLEHLLREALTASANPTEQ